VNPPVAGFDGRWIGAPVPRKEDRRMLLARGRFTDVRSDHIPVLPHEVSAALSPMKDRDP
jgi:hypothetical protein